MTPAETILALVGGVGGLGTAASKVWDWYRSRDAAKLAAEAAEAKVRHEREAAARVSSAGERADIVAVASNDAPVTTLPILPLDDAEAIAQFLITTLNLEPRC